MMTMTFKEAALAADGKLANAPEDLVFSGADIDSRKIEAGMLFIPLAGEHTDGHRYASMVQQAGAAGMLWQKDTPNPPEDFPLILVEDTLIAMGKIARAWLEKVSPVVVGVTGSNGKTSAKDFLASLFAQKWKTWKTQGNHNNEIGLPLTIFEMDDDTEALILEMGMENRGEITYLCSIAPLDFALITSIGSAHLENLGSKLEIARAKCEIVSSLRSFGTLVYHNDTPEIRQAIAELEDQVQKKEWTLVPYGADTEYMPQNLQFSRKGLHFSLPALSAEPFFIPSASSVQAFNATGALLVAKAAGIPAADWHEGLALVDLTRMRGQILEWGKACILDDTYKSNPEAAREALHTLMQIPAKKHVAVLADMLDLGEQEEELHASIGTKANEVGVDILYTYGPRSLATHEAFDGEKKHFEDKEELLEALLALQEQNCAILVKGSRAMAMDTLVKGCLERKSMNKIRLGVIFGGQSSEYSVSLHSAGSFLRSVHTDRYDIVTIGISMDGQFYRYNGSIEDLEHDHWIEHATPIAWMHEGFYDIEKKEAVKLDVVFPILHGKNGEDGAVQGLLTMLDLPTVGCDILGSAICMDKEVMHRLFEQGGIPAADYVALTKYGSNPTFEEIEAKIPLPWVIKPCNAGSSYGVHFVDSKDKFDGAVEDAFKYDGHGKILVEKAIDGFEIGCAVMGDETLETGEIDEIEMKGKIFDFEGKYEMKDSAIYCPARISREKSDEAKELAKKAYRVLCCRDMARVDMFVCSNGDIILNEVNTIPGLTATSRYPSMMKAAGKDFADLIDELVDLAMEKEFSI